MDDKSTGSVAIIGGADGPTSIYIVGKTNKRLKFCIRNTINKWKRKKAEKKIAANSHTLQEVLAYAYRKYNVVEIDSLAREYRSSLCIVNEYLRMGNKAELKGYDSDSEIPMDFHMYEIKFDGGEIHLQMDFLWSYRRRH